MRLWVTIAAVALFVPVPAKAQARKPCEELKTEIATKLEANNVKSYSLEIVGKGEEVEGKVVGSCDGGTKKIVYRRTASATETPSTEAKKP